MYTEYCTVHQIEPINCDKIVHGLKKASDGLQ